MYIFKVWLWSLLFFNLLLHAGTPTLEKVTLQLQWKHQFEFAGFYAAKEKGFYKDAGLDVSLLEYDGGKTIDEVAKGQTDYGVDYSSIISAYGNGKPIVFVANFLKQSPLVIVTQENIKSPAALKHKTIMGVSNTIDNITLINMLNKFDVQMKDIVSVPTSFTLDDFKNKKVDAMVAYTTNELYTLNKLGIKFTLFNPTIYGTEYYDVNLFTSKDKAKKNPEQVKRFKKASIKGWNYALTHKKEIVHLILKKYNSQNKSEDALLYEAQQIENLMLPNVYPVGSIDKNRVKLIAENFRQSGYMLNNNVQIDDFIFEHTVTKHQRKMKQSYLYLSDENAQYLKKKSMLTMCSDPDWMPYEKIKDGKLIGISAAYIEKISEKISIPITLVPSKTWDESLVFFKEKKCDILSLVSPSPSRSSYMSFSSPYFNNILVLATLLDKPFMPDIKELKEKKIGVIKNYASTELLQNKYYDIKFIQVTTLTEGLEKVAKGELYGMIDSLTTISYQIQKRFPSQLKIAGQLKEEIALGIATHKEDQQLLSILNHAIQTIGETSKSKILNNWVSVQFDRSNSSLKAFQKIFIPVVLVFILLILSHYVQRQYNKKLKEQVRLNVEDLRNKDKLLVQQHRMAAMGEMLSMISHQWKQPLGAINSAIMGINIKVASGKFNLSDPAEQKKFLNYLERKHKSILEYVDYLAHTTDDFRNFFNPNKSKELTSLVSPVKNALGIIQASMEKKGIKILTDFKVDKALMLYQNEVMQVILNLLKNSEDNFLEKKIEDPKIMIVTSFKDNQYLIRICDNGGGIEEATAKHIFEPYFSTKNNQVGSGLGLYMSKIIMEDHHYGILKMFNKNTGVCFELLFPAPKESTE